MARRARRRRKSDPEIDQQTGFRVQGPEGFRIVSPTKIVVFKLTKARRAGQPVTREQIDQAAKLAARHEKRISAKRD